jgi:hypothetical protein
LLESKAASLMYFFRILRIFFTAVRFGLDEFFLGHERVKLVRWLVQALFFWRASFGRCNNRAASACVWRWNRSARSSSSSARCCRPGAT